MMYIGLDDVTLAHWCRTFWVLAFIDLFLVSFVSTVRLFQTAASSWFLLRHLKWHKTALSLSLTGLDIKRRLLHKTLHGPLSNRTVYSATFRSQAVILYISSVQVHIISVLQTLQSSLNSVNLQPIYSSKLHFLFSMRVQDVCVWQRNNAMYHILLYYSC